MRLRRVRLRVPLVVCCLAVFVAEMYHIACKATRGHAENPARTRTALPINIQRAENKLMAPNFSRPPMGASASLPQRGGREPAEIGNTRSLPSVSMAAQAEIPPQSG